MQYTSQTNSKQLISYQAFLEQLHNWQLTLTREQKKLRSLRPKIASKILVNELQILITEIEAELIKYRKFKDISRIQKQGRDIIMQYNQNSKKFMECMENIGEFVEKVEQRFGDEFGNGQQNGKIEDTLELEQLQIKQSSRKLPYTRNYQDETFAYSINKQNKHKNLSTALKKQSNSKKPAKKLSSNSSLKHPHTSLNHTLSKLPNNSKTSAFISTSTYGQTSQIDSWQIRYQLKQIKSLMSSIQNEIKYHNHEDIQSQLAKIQHNNKKMSLQLKSVKQDSQYIMQRMQKLKQELATEKQVQLQMIEQFQNPHNAKNKNKKDKSKAHSVGNSRVKQDRDTTAEGVSDWVKVRIGEYN